MVSRLPANTRIFRCSCPVYRMAQSVHAVYGPHILYSASRLHKILNTKQTLWKPLLYSHVPHFFVPMTKDPKQTSSNEKSGFAPSSRDFSPTSAGSSALGPEVGQPCLKHSAEQSCLYHGSPSDLISFY